MTARRTHLIRDHHGQGAITTACGRDGFWNERGSHFQIYHCSNDERVVDLEATNLIADVNCRVCLEAERLRKIRLDLAIPETRHAA